MTASSARGGGTLRHRIAIVIGLAAIGLSSGGAAWGQVCPGTPFPACRTALGSLLTIRQAAAGSHNQLVWGWNRGAATLPGDFADPTDGTAYSLCVYASGKLVADVTVPSDQAAWTARGNHGYRYQDRAGAAASIQKIILKAGDTGRARAFAKGKGANLPRFPLPLTAPLTVQLVNDDSGICWEATYAATAIRRNEDGELSAKFVITSGSAPSTPPPAMLRLSVTNPTGGSVTATFSGMRLSGPDSSDAAAYGQTDTLVPGANTVVIAPPLAPGVWLHTVSVTATGQQQAQQTLVVGDAAQPNTADWTLFPTVLTVNQYDDGGDGTCDATCTLRDAVNTANSWAGPVPVLVQFDRGSPPAPSIAIQITRDEELPLDASGMMIDGTDGLGNPSPLTAFADRTYPTLIVLNTPDSYNSSTCGCAYYPAGTLRIGAGDVRLRGLSIQRRLPSTQVCCGDSDVVAFGARSALSQIDTCRLDGGAASFATAEVPQGETGPPTGKDCIDASATGATSSTPVIVQNSEIRFCYDRGVKSQAGVVSLRNDWIHHNLRGGVFAQSPDTGTTAGVIETTDTMIESNGLNCPTGDPANCGTQGVTRAQADQTSAQGPFTAIFSFGSTLRDGITQGMEFPDQSGGLVVDTYVCGVTHGTNGAGIVVSGSPAGGIIVRGSASVLNGDAGIKVIGSGGADLGSAASPGLNAFNGNASKRNVVNSGNAPMVPAEGNQWQHCYPAGHTDPGTCDVGAIAASDTNNSSLFDIADPQPQLQTIHPVVTAVTPTKAVAGATVRLSGSLFDAVSGQVAGDCRSTLNTCRPVNGTCVEFRGASGSWTPAAEVLAVTPTSATVRSPIDCSEPAFVRVRRLALDGREVISQALAFCHN